MKDKKPVVEFKSFNFEFKELQEDGTFTGYTSIFGNIDGGSDRVFKGSFLRSINARNSSKYEGYFPVLFSHLYKDPAIGKAKFEEDDNGLLTHGKLFIDVWDKAKGIYYNMKEKVSNSMSFMYDIIKSDFEEVDGKQVRNLRELKIFETSILNTGFSMNEMADITNVKDFLIDHKELDSRLKSIEHSLGILTKKEKIENFDGNIEKEMKALRDRFSELAFTKGTPENPELATVKKTIQDLTSQIKNDLKLY